MKTRLFWRFFSAFMLLTLATVLLFSGVAEGLNIAFLHPKSTCGILTELCEHHE